MITQGTEIALIRRRLFRKSPRRTKQWFPRRERWEMPN